MTHLDMTHNVFNKYAKTVEKATGIAVNETTSSNTKEVFARFLFMQLLKRDAVNCTHKEISQYLYGDDAKKLHTINRLAYAYKIPEAWKALYQKVMTGDNVTISRDIQILRNRAERVKAFTIEEVAMIKVFRRLAERDKQAIIDNIIARHIPNDNTPD